nr:hypothetical protein [Tanacetum cinerariifolium]
MVNSKGLIVEAYELDEEEVSSNKNEMVEVKVLMALAEDNDVVSKEVDESSFCNTPLPPLKKLDSAEPTSGSKAIKLILRSKSTFKAKALKGVTINEPSSAPAKGNKRSSALKVHSAPAGPIMLFGDDSTCTTEGYGSIKCNGIAFTKVQSIKLCKQFAKLMIQRYEMSMIVKTPMVPPNNLGHNLSGKAVNETQYRDPKESYLVAIKRIFRYLKGSIYKSPTQYKEYLSEFWYTVKTLPDSKVWVSTLTGRVRGEIVSPWFMIIGYSMEIGANRTLKKSYLPPKWRENINPYPRFISLLPEHMMPEYDNEELTINLTQVFSVHNQTLKPNQHEEFPFTTYIKAIYNLDVPMDYKAPTPSLQTEEVIQGKKHKDKKKDTESSLAKDKISSHPSPPIPVVGEMHKEAQQAASGPTSLGATRPNPSVLVDKTKSAEDGLKTTHTNSCANKESKANHISLKVKLVDLLDILKDTRSAFFTPDSSQDEPIIVTDESEEEEADKDDTHTASHNVPKDTSVPPPPSPKSTQIQELMA